MNVISCHGGVVLADSEIRKTNGHLIHRERMSERESAVKVK
jgi:hypothetical protein